MCCLKDGKRKMMFEKILFCPHCGMILPANPGAEWLFCTNCASRGKASDAIIGLFSPTDANHLRHPLMEQSDEENAGKGGFR